MLILCACLDVCAFQHMLIEAEQPSHCVSFFTPINFLKSVSCNLMVFSYRVNFHHLSIYYKNYLNLEYHDS
ncbi:MAG: hypothetical protein LBJ32_01215 [Oscillospiraceae bacterium]|nr:hypothetical protein [Oscillospiraceae bacterium]